MTSQTILTKAMFGQGWAPFSTGVLGRREQFPRRTDPSPFDLNSLQERIVPEEPRSEQGSESESAESHLSPITLQHPHEAREAVQVERHNTQEELTLGETAGRILGENGLRRFEEFARYQRGWDLGRGEALSSRSVAFVNAFLNRLPELEAARPSLFLTHDGNLQLGWEDREGHAIEIEFGPDRVEYYLEGSHEERTIRLEALPHFIGRIKSLIE